MSNVPNAIPDLYQYRWNFIHNESDIPVLRTTLRERLVFQANLKLTLPNFGFLALSAVLVSTALKLALVWL
jgi:hypothetical protein